MNLLSTRLYSSLISPAAQDIRRSSSLHASAASLRIPNGMGGEETVGACLRQQYYRVAGEVPTDISDIPDWGLSSLIGNKLHDLITDLIEEHGFSMGLQLIKAEHSFFDPSINLSSRSDILAYDHWSNEVIGIEVKSVGEYKAGKFIERRCPEHVLQSMIYLDYYQRSIPADQKAPEKWYIWYISRTENWTIKGKKHGSPFAMLWDFYLTLEGVDGTVRIHTADGSELWDDYSITKIHNRYKALTSAIESNSTPERDYDLKYSEERLAGMYKLDKIQYKKDKEPIAKWIKKGAKPGELKLEMGDFECRVCPWKSKCWAFPVDTYKDNPPYNLPTKVGVAAKKVEEPVL